MSLTHDAIAALAPDQASLKAANGMTKPKKWPTRARSEAEPLVWGSAKVRAQIRIARCLTLQITAISALAHRESFRASMFLP
ncbi:swim zinc finger domain-containing protein [Roseibium sp. TrichSKD4]|uniref:hypothetical protein n=1 Tax=Roseibium sp. TrichSKD4 TaxID=744980 RepID=UPI0001E5616D|nr:hypothetical protein [Roseibium sp. TrichSKD4]EFO32903.1 swim zinc finger domain-containing protein [Roseibium sp. TrichSKD4]